MLHEKDRRCAEKCEKSYPIPAATRPSPDGGYGRSAWNLGGPTRLTLPAALGPSPSSASPRGPEGDERWACGRPLEAAFRFKPCREARPVDLADHPTRHHGSFGG